MTRCTNRPLRLALAACCAALLAAVLPAGAQQLLPGNAGQRPFPPAALRGSLKIVNMAEAELNGKAIRLAPGLRIFNPQNALVFAHSLTGQNVKVNYVTEASTGMLLTAWILTEAEARQPRKGDDAVITNIRTEPAATPR